MPARKIFLSHASADRAKADRIAKVLKAHSLNVWYSPKKIVGAQQWQDEIGAALEKCNWFVVLLSQSSVSSRWVKRELQYALTKSRYENHIVPVLLEGCDYEGSLSWTLPTFQIVTM